MSNKEYLQWYQSLPVYNNEQPRQIEDFNSNEKFEDPNFPPKIQSLVTPEIIQNLNDDYIKNSSIPVLKEYLEKQIKRANDFNNSKFENYKIEWKRISEFIPNAELFPTELHCDCFSQNYIGDCYFVDMISLISNYGELLKRLFPIEKNSFGYYEVILFINGWKRVIIDDYFPVLFNESNNNFIFFTAQSKKFSNCFYCILLEKAWAKINKTYFNIYGGFSNHSLLILTGFKGEKKTIKYLTKREKDFLIQKLKIGIRKEGYLCGVNSNKHAYSLIDIEKYRLNNQNYFVLKVRNPWGFNSTDFLENSNILNSFATKNNNNDNYSLNTRLIVEDELKPLFGNFDSSPDEGIFYISSENFYQCFESIEICQNIFGCSFIEIKFNIENEQLRKNYFIFNLIVNEDSLAQFNLTTHKYDKNGKINFNSYITNIQISNIRTINEYLTVLPKGNYYIQFKYINDSPNEILF